MGGVKIAISEVNMKYYLDGKLLFIDMRQKYTHAACMGDRVIACCHSAEEAENVCSALREEKRKFIDELLFALNSDEVYGRGGYQLTGDTAKRQHISDIRSRYKNTGELHMAISRARHSLESIEARELTVTA